MIRICVEFLAPAALRDGALVRLLARHRVSPMLALRDGDNDPAPPHATGDADGGLDADTAAARAADAGAREDSADRAALLALRPYLEAGLAPAAWPLLRDADGYWPSVDGAEKTLRRTARLLATMDAVGVRLPWVAIDLEPPLDATTRLHRGPLRAALPALAAEVVAPARRRAFAAAERHFAALQRGLLQRNIASLAVVWPMVGADLVVGGRAMQRLFSSPLRVGWDRVALMTYGSILAGLAGPAGAERGLLSLEDARWYAYRALSRLVRSIRAAADDGRAGGVGGGAEAGAGGGAAGGVGAFVGLVGGGKLGDEPVYQHPDELFADVAAARAAGVVEVSLYGLEGVLADARPERWLEALNAPAAAPPRRLRGELLHRAVELAARALDPLSPCAPRRGPRE